MSYSITLINRRKYLSFCRWHWVCVAGILIIYIVVGQIAQWYGLLESVFFSAQSVTIPIKILLNIVMPYCFCMALCEAAIQHRYGGVIAFLSLFILSCLVSIVYYRVLLSQLDVLYQGVWWL